VHVVGAPQALPEQVSTLLPDAHCVLPFVHEPAQAPAVQT
jgi:hypothetical protein